jgi:hypothetical protein
LKAEPNPPIEGGPNEGTSLVSLYKTMLRIIDQLNDGVAPSEKGEYIGDTVRQTVELALDDPADPASAEDTRRAETHFTRIRL